MSGIRGRVLEHRLVAFVGHWKIAAGHAPQRDTHLLLHTPATKGRGEVRRREPTRGQQYKSSESRDLVRSPAARHFKRKIISTVATLGPDSPSGWSSNRLAVLRRSRHKSELDASPGECVAKVLSADGPVRAAVLIPHCQCSSIRSGVTSYTLRLVHLVEVNTC